jgi:hypothetical protein
MNKIIVSSFLQAEALRERAYKEIICTERIGV